MATKNRPKRDPKKGPEKLLNSFPLAAEVKTYETHLLEWLDREGQFVLIKKREILGFFSRYEEALEAGYKRFGNESFLVKQILRHEPVYQMGQIEF